MDVPDNFYDLVETVCRDLYIQSLKEIPPDVVEAIQKAAQRETLTAPIAIHLFSSGLSKMV